MRRKGAQLRESDFMKRSGGMEGQIEEVENGLEIQTLN